MAPSSRDRLNTIKNSSKRRRELAGLRNTAANAGPPSSSKYFSTKPPEKSNARKALSYGWTGAKLFLPDPKVIDRAWRDPVGTGRGLAEIASFTSPGLISQRAVNYLRTGDLAMYGADMEEVEQGAEVMGFIPFGKLGAIGAKVAAKAAKAGGTKLGRTGLESAAAGIVKQTIGPQARRKSGRSLSQTLADARAAEEAEDVAASLAEAAQKTSRLTIHQAKRATGPPRRRKRDPFPGVTSEQDAAIRGLDLEQQPRDPGEYAIPHVEVDTLAGLLRDKQEVAERLAMRVNPQEYGIDFLPMLRALGLGRGYAPDASLSLDIPDTRTLVIGGFSPDDVVKNANDMFKSGAREMESIVEKLSPGAGLDFPTEPLKPERAKELLELLQDARGGIATVRGRVLDEQGNPIKSLSQELYSAQDHASAKAGTGVRVGMTHLLADILNIKLPKDYLDAEQEWVKFVNNPNVNDVVTDFLGNTGKGGFRIEELKDIVTAKLAQDPQDRTALGMKQMLDPGLWKEYSRVAKAERDILGSVDNPLAGVVENDVLDLGAKYIDMLRRKKINEKQAGYTAEMYEADFDRFKQSIISAAARLKPGEKLDWFDIISGLQ